MSSLVTGTRINNLVEGTPDAVGARDEPDSPRQRTAQMPAVKIDTDPHHNSPAAETGMVPAVNLQAQGSDKSDAQDASRTTAETQVSISPEIKVTFTRSVLIIEDTPELIEVIEASLERINVVTDFATHGDRALEKFDAMNPAVILLDIALPDISGWKVLEAIKKRRKAHGVMPRIIVITAYGDPANRLVGKFQDVYEYLIKPFTPEQVERVVTQALSERA